MKRATMHLMGVLLLLCFGSISAQNRQMKMLNAEVDDQVLIDAVFQDLDSIYSTNPIKIDEYINIFIEQCNRSKREFLKNEVVKLLYVAGLPKEPTGELRSMMKSIGVLIGDKAPDFAINDSITLYDLSNKMTLLFFYEASCSNCSTELELLKGYYETLESQSVQLVSIDCNVKTTIKRHWKYNLADSRGSIYIPYGVLSTPTYLLIGEDKTILKRGYQLSDVLENK